MRKLFSYILAVLLVLSICPQAYAKEEGTLSGWGRYYHDCTADNASFTLDDEYSRHGAYSAKISYNLPTKSNRYLELTSVVKGLKKNAKYKCGMSVKAKNAGSIYLSFDWKGSNHLTPLGKTFDWVDLSFYFSNTYDFTNMTLRMIIESTTKAFWFDDVYFCEVLEDGTLGENLVSNGTFDVGGNVVEKENEQVNGLYSLYRDIESRNTFTLDEIKQVSGAFKYAPVYEAKNITLDGSLADWEGYPKFGLPTKPDQYQIYISGSNKDVDAYCQYAYDKENFYLAIHVIDDIFYESPNLSNYWQGDSIQLAICDVGQVYDAEIGFAHHQETGVPSVHSRNYGDEVLKAIKLKTAQQGNETIYEAAIPWSLRYDDGQLPDGFLFDIIVNDNDGEGRAYCVELAPGIAEGKTSAAFPYLEFMTGRKDYYAWIQGPNTVTQNEETEFSYYLVNEGDEKAVRLSSSNGDIDEKITIPANSGIRRTFKTKFQGHGNVDYTITAKTDDESVNASFGVKVQPSIESFDSIFEDMNRMAKELQELIDECAANGISADYELVNLTVIKKFAEEILPFDVEMSEYERAFYQYDCCKELFDEAKTACESYLAGRTTPQTVTRFKTGEVTIDGRIVYATTETDGIMEKRPFFFTGYGHFPSAIAPDIPNFQKFGTNIIQISLEPQSVVVPQSGENLFRFNPDAGSAVRMKEYFKTAEENDIQICLLLGIHQLGDTIRNTYPQIVGKSVANVEVAQGDIKVHPVMKKLIKVHVKGVLDLIGDSPALNSICLTNEPTNNCNSDYYQPYWAQYLTELYKADINNLNEAYGTDYKGFLDVPMPESVSSTRWFYDYKQFNDKVLTEFHKVIAECVKEYNPDIKTHAKMMSMSTKTEGQKHNFLSYGTDHELIAPYSDYNGNDCYGMLYDMTGWNLLEGMEFYDMQVGMNNAPVFNSEDHFIADKTNNFEPLQADFTETSQWQGYMHAKAASTIWSWDRSYNPDSSFYNGIDSRPDCIAKVGKTNFDANRLAYEIKAIIEKEPQIAMITSTNARVFSSSYMNCMWKVYTNCLYNGQKVKFIVESQMDQLKNYKALVLTNLNNVKDSTVEAIKNYVDNGGKVIMLGENLGYNELNQPRDENIVNYIKAKSQVIETTDDSVNITAPSDNEFFDIVTNLAKEIDEDKVYVIDTETGERVKDVEIEYAEYNGNIVLNMANYSYDEKPKKVKIFVNGEQARNIYNLRREYQMGDEIELTRYQPMFVRLGDNSLAPTERQLRIFINDEEYIFDDAKPYIDGRNRTLVPIRFIAEALGAEVDWNDGVVYIKKGEDAIEYAIGEYQATKNGEIVEFDTCGELKNDRTFVPVRYISELLSAQVDWNANEYSVLIKSN